MLDFEFNEIPENEIEISDELLEEMKKVPILKRDYERKHYFQNVKYASNRDYETQNEIDKIEKEDQLEKIVEPILEQENDFSFSRFEEKRKEELKEKQRDKIEDKKEKLKSYMMQQEDKNEYLGKSNLDEIVEKLGDDIEAKEDNLEEASDIGTLENLEKEADMTLVDDMKINIDTNYKREEYYIHVRKAMSNGTDLGREQVNGLKIDMLKEAKEYEADFDDVVKMARSYTAIEKRDPELNKEFARQNEQEFGMSRY